MGLLCSFSSLGGVCLGEVTRNQMGVFVFYFVFVFNKHKLAYKLNTINTPLDIPLPIPIPSSLGLVYDS